MILAPPAARDLKVQRAPLAQPAHKVQPAQPDRKEMREQSALLVQKVLKD